jgi:hypothetical protein
VHAGQVFATMAYDASGKRLTKAVNGTGSMDATTHYYLSGQSAIETRNGPDRLLQPYVHGLAYVDELVQVGLAGDPATQTACDRFYLKQKSCKGDARKHCDPDNCDQELRALQDYADEPDQSFGIPEELMNIRGL